MSEKSSVESLKDKLYSRLRKGEVDPNARTPLSSRPGVGSDIHLSGTYRAADAEETPPQEEQTKIPPPMEENSLPIITRMQRLSAQKNKRSTATYFVWSSFAFFLVAAGIAAYALLGGFNTISSDNIDLQIIAPSLVDSGDSVTVQYLLVNRNTTPLQSADLVIDYPEGTRSAGDQTLSVPRERISVGAIDSGGQVKKTSSVLFFGAEGTQRKISATLEYQIAGSNSIFTKQADVLFTIGSAPISLAVTSQSEAISGQKFSIDIAVSSNSSSPLSNVAVQAQYPFGFTVNSVTPAAQAGNTIWHLGQMDPGTSQKIHIEGTLTGEDGDERVFHFLAGSESDPTETTLALPILSVPQSLTVRKPFISGTLSFNGKSGSSVSLPLGEPITGLITWQNNLQESVSNLSLALSFSGAPIDQTSVQAQNGFYDSTKNQIIWDTENNSAFGSVPPGASGTVQFSFSTSKTGASSLVNPKVTLNLGVRAQRQGGGNTPEEVASAASATIELSSLADVSAKALHFSGPFNNVGPMPPTVGTNTTYTIMWSVKNSSNTIANAHVRAALPPYVTFSGAGTAGNENISYDESTRTVTWNLGDVKAGVGYNQAARQAAFQVILTPSVSQVGRVPALTGAIEFSGEDRFAQTTVSASAPAVTTELTGDTGYSKGMDVVKGQ